MSFFGTIHRINRVRCYADAKYLYENTKPIRGSNNLIPLGARRDASRYYIQKTEAGEYQVFLYRTPLVTYFPNGEIHVRTHGHNTLMTMQFVARVLGINARRTRGQSVFGIDGEMYVVSGDGYLTLHGDGCRYKVINRQKHQQYVISRSGANSVRRRYSEFRNYLKGFISLRSESLPSQQWNNDSEIVCVKMGVTELVEVLGSRTQDDSWNSSVNGRPVQYVETRAVQGIVHKGSRDYKRINVAFDGLIKNDQPEETKHINFYQASVALVVAAYLHASNHAIAVSSPDRVIYMEVNRIKIVLDEIQFKWFSDEVFVIADVPDDKVPNHKYSSWVN